MLREYVSTVPLLACVAICGCTNPDYALQPLTFDAAALDEQLEVVLVVS